MLIDIVNNSILLWSKVFQVRWANKSVRFPKVCSAPSAGAVEAAGVAVVCVLMAASIVLCGPRVGTGAGVSLGARVGSQAIRIISAPGIFAAMQAQVPIIAHIFRSARCLEDTHYGWLCGRVHMLQVWAEVVQ